MKIIFLKELKKYTYTELKRLSSFDDSELELLLNELKDKGIINSDNNTYLVFEYIGLISYKNVVLSIYPKYCSEENKITELKTILNLYNHYRKRKILNSSLLPSFGIFSENENGNFLSLVLYLLEDYYDNGLYRKDQDNYQENGHGEIDWVNTIENKIAYLQNGSPIYLNYLTIDVINDQRNFICKVHKFILEESLSQLKLFDVFNIFNITELDFKAEELHKDTDYIINMLDSELEMQFTDRNISLLKALKEFILIEKKRKNEGSIKIFGATSFYNIWEEICSVVMKNEYFKFKDRMPRPYWVDIKTKNVNYKDTLIPDIIRYFPDTKKVYIFDAKYYHITFSSSGKLIGNPPGVEDISKQYLYNIALNTLIPNISEYKCFNVFLIPTEQETKIIGYAKFDIFENMNEIILMQLNTQNLYKRYVTKSYYENEFFNFFIKQYKC